MEKILWSAVIGLLSAFVSFKLLEQKVDTFIASQAAANTEIVQRINRVEHCLITRTCTK